MAKKPFIVARFGGLNTEAPVNKTASGTARVARNVRITDGALEGRPGFASFDANAGDLSPIISAAVFPLATGDIYLAVKRNETSTAGIDYARVYNATSRVDVAISWTDMVDAWSGHVVTERGWWFVHKDRLYHDDHVGMSKWHPTTTNKPAAIGAETAIQRAWKGGIGSSIGPILLAAVGGAMHGHYFAGAVKKNSVTRELSCIQDLQGTSASVDQAAGNGGLTVTNSGSTDAIQATAADNMYEWDSVQLVRSMGNTENAFGADSPSFRLRFDTSFARGTVADASMSISDATLGTRLRHTNAGGTPVPAQHGAYNGARAVYGGCFYDSALVPGQIAFSLQGFPCMVPGDQTYTAGGVSLTWAAEPYNGFVNAGVSGRTQAIRPVGNRFVVWTDAESFWLVPLPHNGTLYPRASGVVGGCVADECAVASPYAAYALGSESMTVADGRGVRNVATSQFTPTLTDIPAAYRHYACGAYCSDRKEVWWAVARAHYDCDGILAEDYAIAGSAYSDIASTKTDAGAGWSHDYQMLPDTPVDKDAVYFRWTAKPSSISLYLPIGRPAQYADVVGDAVMEWGYYDNTVAEGVWAALTAYEVGDVLGDTGDGGDNRIYECIAERDDTSSDHPADDTTHWELNFEPLTVTDGTNPDDSSGGRPFEDDGTITADSPTHWAALTIDETTGYYLRCRVKADMAADVSTPPILTSHGPTRVLVYDEQLGTLTGWFDPRNLLGGYIAWMCELARPTDSPPKMLLFLSTGRIVYYPATVYYDADGLGTSANYSTEWEGYFGQEYRHRESRDAIVTLHTGDMARRVNVAVAGLKTGSEDIDGTDATLEGADDILTESIAWDAYRNGKLFKVRFSTTASDQDDDADVANSPDWQVVDVILSVTT